MKWFAQRGTKVAIVEADTEGGARVMALPLLTKRVETVGIFADKAPLWDDRSTLRPATPDDIERCEAVQRQRQAFKARQGDQMHWDV